MDFAIYAACHKKCALPAFDFLRPVYAGAALGGAPDGLARDDAGENISSLNRCYCELTVQYWARHNEGRDYYGFCHYRRFLSFAGSGATACLLPSADTSLLASRFGYTAENISSLCSRFDILLPRAEECFGDCRGLFDKAKAHGRGDLAAAEQIIRQSTPGFARCADEYLSGTKQYFGNMFLMRRELFFEYSDWLFGILSSLDSLRGTPARADGYVAERLLGVFVTKARAEGARVAELPRLILPRSAAERAGYALFPAGSRRKALFKAITRR